MDITAAKGQLHVRGDVTYYDGTPEFKDGGDQEEVRLRRETWAAATEYMPFNTNSKMKCCMPKSAPLDEHEVFVFAFKLKLSNCSGFN
jgi:hypothetical protein